MKTSAAKSIDMLTLVKGVERYVFLFDDAHRAEVILCMGRWAQREDLAFTWQDAAALTLKIKASDQSKEVSR